jgi:hypothetical protein
MSKLEQLETAALELPTPQRAQLAHKLIASLDAAFDERCEQVWLEEAKRRDAEFADGKVVGRPAEEVLRNAYRRIGCPG